MSRHSLPLRLLPLALSALLAACATVPAPAPAPIAAPVTAPPPVAPPTVTNTATLDTEPDTDTDTSDVWDRLRSSFAMSDCTADPGVLRWAHRYTRNPHQFENEVRAALPKLVYVQKVAAEHHVAGEFVLLPWIESGFRPIPGRHGRPAGMWQIMPVTASAMGLRVNRTYDARLNVKASADAVMKLLSRYHDQFHDWRIAAYAYNAGEYNARLLMQRHGLPPASPTIPHWPVRDGTRQHLTKLLAMACVIREPGRFNVSLPVLSPSQHLVSVPLPKSMPLSRAADNAGMSLDHMKDLNAGFRNDIADTSVASYLMMPAGHARQFRDALLNQIADASADRENNDSFPGTGFTMDTAAPSAAANAPPRMRHARRERTHRVKSGETLWQLARHYDVSVRDLERWNHLKHGKIKPGQTLRVGITQ